MTLGVLNLAEGQLVLALARDISERKLAEEELSKQRKLLENERNQFFNILDELPAYVYLQVEDYTIAYANKYFIKRFGETGNSLCHQVIRGSDEPCQDCRTFKVFETGQPQSWIWEAKPGETIYQIYDYPYKDPNGNEYVLEMGIDITSQKKAEDELRKHRDHLDELVQDRTRELQALVKAMSGREIRMVELKKAIERLRKQLHDAGMTPVADDSLKY